MVEISYLRTHADAGQVEVSLAPDDGGSASGGSEGGFTIHPRPVLLDAWRPKVKESEISQWTIDFMDGAGTEGKSGIARGGGSAAGFALLTFSTVKLDARQVALRGGLKIKIMEIRSC